jgi:hypothetical protein
MGEEFIILSNKKEEFSSKLELAEDLTLTDLRDEAPIACGGRETKICGATFISSLRTVETVLSLTLR